MVECQIVILEVVGSTPTIYQTCTILLIIQKLKTVI